MQQGVLGEKLGEGHTADVHAWAPGQVVKLFRADVPRRIPRYEAFLTRAVFEAGGPAPRVLAEVVVDGRLGIVLPRLQGPTLRDALKSGAVTVGEGAGILAGLALSVHETPTPAGVLSLKAYMDATVRLAPDALSPRAVAGLFALIDCLPRDDRLSHSDLHPGNVILTDQGPRLIDWIGLRRGGPAYDLACAHFLRTELAPEGLGDPDSQRAFDAAMQAAYAQQAGTPRAQLSAAVAAHLPLARAFFLLGGLPRPPTRARLRRSLEQDFG